MLSILQQIEDVLYEHYPAAYENGLGYPDIDWSVTEVAQAIMAKLGLVDVVIDG